MVIEAKHIERDQYEILVNGWKIANISMEGFETNGRIITSDIFSAKYGIAYTGKSAIAMILLINNDLISRKLLKEMCNHG